MGKLTRDLKVGDKIKILGESYLVEAIDLSNVGKQGKRKGRIEMKSASGEKSVIIRPEDFEIETI